MLRIVLDSCVLFPMYLRDTLLRASEAGFYLAFLVEVVQKQSQSLKKPPMNFRELLELLNREVPGFVSNILSHQPENL